MKKQWRKFLDENESNWPYGIVPELVKRLADAVDAGDDKEVKDLLVSLYSQGVILDDKDNLCFVADCIY